MTPARPRRFARRSLLAAAAALGLSALVPSVTTAADAPATPADGHKLKVLYLTQSRGFRHQPVIRNGNELASSEVAFIDYGKRSGLFEVEPTQDATVIMPEKLKSIDVLAFYTTGALPISAESWAAVQEWVGSGKGGFVGIHSATDTQWDYAGPGVTYTKFINGQFAGHPWGANTPATIVTHEPSHPTVKAWGPSFEYAEEIYQYKNYDPAAVRVLQSLDLEHTALKKPYSVPVTWVREIGAKGRLFYTNLGHKPETWQDPRFRETIVEAVKWVSHQTDGPAAPNPEAQAVWTIHSFVAYGPDGKGQPKDGPQASAVAAKLASADKAWLTETAGKITALRGAAPPDLNAPKAPNKADAAKDPKKYADAVAAYAEKKAKYEKELPANKLAAEKLEVDRKALLADILAKAGK